MNVFLSRFSALAGAAFLAAPWVLSFSPFSEWYVGLCSLLLLPLLIEHCKTLGQAARAGLVFGVVVFATGAGWLYVSLHTYGGLPVGLAVAAILAYSALLAQYPVLAAMLYYLAQKAVPSHWAWRGWLLVPVWAALWTFTEWWRGSFQYGFAWLSLGDALVDSPFNNLLPWLGSYGALWVVLLGLGWLRELVLPATLARPTWPRVGKRVFGAKVGLALVLGLSVVWAVRNPPVYRSTPALAVAGVQPNVDQSIKFDPQQIGSNMNRLFSMGKNAALLLGPKGLVLFPETVSPLLWSDSPAYWREQFREIAAAPEVSVLTGAAIEDHHEYFNSIVQIHGNEDDMQLLYPAIRHDKRHLVPLGEFVPWGYRWFVNALRMPMSDFTHGHGAVRVFSQGQSHLLAGICYEDTFSGEFAALAAQAAHKGAEPTHLLNVSNLGWFGKSLALEQHAQMGRARSSEHRKPLVRVTNTGVSGVIGPEGQWLHRIQSHKQLVWSERVPGALGLTFFVRYGQTIWFALWGASVLPWVVAACLAWVYNRPRLVR
ncbi:MAG: apolipoprotein N-acyltransferase [Limnobacter sp.]|nr:apolipoprotein N-acyltransferase [Limnobacter sp.]